MIIEKKTVIKALQTEPLSYGMWFHGEDQKTCSVCAVGAVVRKSFKSKIGKYDSGELSGYCRMVTRDDYGHQSIARNLKEKNYLAALSNYFEMDLGRKDDYGQDNGTVDDSIRVKLVEFVRKNFPTRFKVEDIT